MNVTKEETTSPPNFMGFGDWFDVTIQMENGEITIKTYTDWVGEGTDNL